MIHSIRNQNHLSSRRSTKLSLKRLLLLPAAGVFLSLSSCKDDVPAPPASFITDTAPVGDGLKVIGFAVLGAAVVIVLGRMLK